MVLKAREQLIGGLHPKPLLLNAHSGTFNALCTCHTLLVPSSSSYMFTPLCHALLYLHHSAVTVLTPHPLSPPLTSSHPLPLPLTHSNPPSSPSHPVFGRQCRAVQQSREQQQPAVSLPDCHPAPLHAVAAA